MDEVLRLSGRVGPLHRGTTRAGRPFVRAEVQPDGAAPTTVYWWSEDSPPEGSTVAVAGRQKDGGNVWVDTWRLLVAPDTPFAHRVLAYLGGCVAAEATEGLLVDRDSRTRVYLTSGEAPVVGVVNRLPDDPAIARWARRRVTAGQAETVVSGWPVVSGSRKVDGSTSEVVAPLLFCEARVVSDGKGFVVEPVGDAVDLNPEALRLLGVAREERDWAAGIVDELPASMSMQERALRLLEELRGASMLPDVALDPHSLGPVTPGHTVHNAALCFVSDGDRAVFTRALLQDLSELTARRTEELSAGPLGVLLGLGEPGLPGSPQPMPVVVPTNAEQEAAVAAAMSAVLTVVTGPPGTGKTQVLVNVAAAAVAGGETVLLASKNNHAIDVVAGRLRAMNSEAAPVRTGKSDRAREAAGEIRAALGRPTVAPGDLADARDRWEQVRRAALPLYEQLMELHRLQGELAAADSALQAHLTTLPAGLGGVHGPVEREVLVASHQRAVRLLDELDRTPDRWLRRRRRRRMEAEADGQVQTTIGQFDSEAQGVLTGIHLGSGGRAALAAVAAALAAVDLRERFERARRALELAPGRDEAWRAVDQSLVGRIAHGNHLVAAAWRERLRAASSTARNRAGAYAVQLADGSRSSARGSMPDVLPTFPVWAVTSLASGSNLPLRGGLFDLVVIDEASQSDLASAIPLFFRAKRALVVGDPHQLTHITSVSARRDEQLARTAGLSEEEHGRFSYNATSLFAAAERVYNREPVFLRQHFRSHPDVIGFSNREVYGDRLVVRTLPDRFLPGMAVEWVDCAGPWEHGRNGRSVRKPVEAEVVLDELERQWKELEPLGRSLGVVSPFRAHVELLRDRLGLRLPSLVGKLAIDTAHGFQGDERDVMILSPSVGAGLPARTIRFAGDRNLVNVAVTRARARLVVVGDHGACLASGSLLAALAQYALDLGAVR